MPRALICTLLLAALGFSQAPKKFTRNTKNALVKPSETSVTISGKTISISYSAPSLRGRKIFGEGGIVSRDSTYPIWRAGADNATWLHTDADLDINGLKVPAGDYTLWAKVDSDPWQLVVNKQTGQWGTNYDAGQDLGRVNMTMTKPHTPIETYVMTLSSSGGNKGTLRMSWENVAASVDFTVK